jgi:LPS-assembly protein
VPFFSFPLPTRRSLLLLLAALLLMVPSAEAAVSADTRHWDISADTMTRYENPPRLVAKGNVILQKKEPVTKVAPKPASPWDPLLPATPQSREAEDESAQPVTTVTTVTTVKADTVTYNIEDGVLEAKGNLTIDIGADHLRAESGRIDLRNATGSFENAAIIRREKELHFEGRTIEKTGDLSYHIEDGWVVTCKLKPGQTAPWSFAAADTQVTDGGYALLKHATFRILDVPVLYTPYMILPAKRKRQTGLLFPTFSTSDRDGFSVETPLFINLSPSADITLTPRYFAKRGIMHGGEFRFVSDEESKGMLMANLLDDRLSDPSEVAYYRDGSFTHTNSNRYWVRGKADQDLGKWTTRLDLDLVSDADYLREFDTGSTGFSHSDQRFEEVFGRGFIDKNNRYRENTLAALRSWDNGTALLGEAKAINDVSEKIYSANDPSRPWKLPSFTYSGLIPLTSDNTGPDFSWNANYSNYYREEGVGAQRLDLAPTITMGVPLGRHLESSVSGGLRNTSYLINDNGADEWKNTDSRNRFMANLGGEIATTLMRDFDFGDTGLLNHVLRPFVAYAYTTNPDEKHLPRFDRLDELEEQNTIYYGINNYFNLSGLRNGRPVDREFGYFKIKHGYDMRSSMSDKPLSPVIAETGWYPLDNMRLKYLTNIDVYGDGAFLHSFEGDYRNSSGDMVSVDYRYNEQTDINSISTTLWYNLPHNFAAGYELERTLETRKTIEEIFRLRFTQPCWSVELSSNSTPGDHTVMLTFRLANIGLPLGVGMPGSN